VNTLLDIIIVQLASISVLIGLVVVQIRKGQR
jgi:hypothetical protein